MDPSAFSAGDGRPSPTKRELQGPRPSPLRVSKDSFKIKKPPIAPQMYNPPPPQPYAAVSNQNRQTVVIYTVSPKVIHTTASDFMNLVQRLTGPSPRAAESPAVAGRAGDVSPAARFASIEKASTSQSQSQSQRENIMVDSHESIMDILQGTSAQISQFPGILTPGPATLPPASPAGLFSPAVNDPFGLNMFLQSPSILFSPTTIVSPNYSLDFYNAFFDF